MRICDIIAILARQTGRNAPEFAKESPFTAGAIGTTNGEIINNFSVNIIEKQLWQRLFEKWMRNIFDALRQAKKENYEMIYNNKSLNDLYEK